MLFHSVAVPSAQAQTTQPTSYAYAIQQEAAPYQPPTPRVIARNFRDSLLSTLQEVHALEKRAPGWDGYDAPAPNPRAIARAIRELPRMSELANSTRFSWQESYVSSDENGNVSLEWWQGRRKVTVYVSPDEMDYVKVWGTNIFDEMEDGKLSDLGAWRAVWDWLHS